jgi:glycosyltransferase involved in cell wall biosynthesis
MSRRLLVVENSASYAVSHRFPLLKKAQDEGIDVHVTALTSGAAPKIEEAGFAYHPLASGARSSNPLREIQLIARLAALYRRLQPDLVHHITLRSVLYGGIASLAAPGPAVVNAVTGLGYLFSSEKLSVRLLRTLVLKAVHLLTQSPRHRFIFQNPDDQALFQSRGVVRPGASHLIKGSGVDMSRFDRQPLPSGTPLVVFPARMLWQKGVQEFVDAAALLRDAGTEARFVLVGDTDPNNPASVPEARLRKWDENGPVEWWGYQDDMPAVFARASVVCLPSAYREGVPKVLIEAASAGRPIVTTDMPGCREIVRDGENGRLVPSRNAHATAEALQDLLQNPRGRDAMGRRGRAIVRQEFSVEHVVAETLKVYRRALDRANRQEQGVPA